MGWSTGPGYHAEGTEDDIGGSGRAVLRFLPAGALTVKAVAGERRAETTAVIEEGKTTEVTLALPLS